MTEVRTAKYDISVEARLVVEIGKGGEHGNRPATIEDLKRFGYVDPHEAYMRFERWVCDTLELDRDKDITGTVANPLRYAVECALHYPHMPDRDTQLDLRRLQAVNDAMTEVVDLLGDKGGSQTVDAGTLRAILAPIFMIDRIIEANEARQS